MSNSVMERPQPVTPLAQRVLAEQIKIIILQTPQAVAAPAALAAISAVALWDKVADIPALLIMLFLIHVTLFWWLTFYWRYKRDYAPAADIRKWAHGTTLRTAAQGCCWGAYSLVIFVPDSIAYQSFDVAFMYGLVAGAVVVDGPHYRTFAAFAVPTLLPVILRCFFEGTPASLGVGIAGLVGLSHSLFAALNSCRTTVTSVRTRFENMDLVRELERQKETAERARAEADAANQAKSRFLAAASHDLRQPVHALGLFVSAAKLSASERERLLIMDHIERSVGSLADLFDSLLDISRLDAGILHPQVRAVALLPILRKLAAEYEPEANERKLRFRVRCPDLTIRTDPLLFERIMRNLVTNALRYTKSGGILVACRKRGAYARVEVRDTGIGIAPEKQARVFEEFYQIGNPERDRRNGVGLGLAIVKRTSALLQHPVQLASRIGQGSRFSIEVPISVACGDEAGQPASLALGDETVLLGTVIAVIDDEADILAAVELLLKQWGCAVIAAGSGPEAKDKLQAGGIIPDIILSDYRLRGNETGIDAIRALRSAFGNHISAMLLTGDTATGPLRDAAASGLEVLHKPLNAEQLKQALINTLTVPRPASPAATAIQRRPGTPLQSAHA